MASVNPDGPEKTWNEGIRDGCLCGIASVRNFSTYFGDLIELLGDRDGGNDDDLLIKLDFVDNLVINGFLCKHEEFCRIFYDALCLLTKIKFSLLTHLLRRDSSNTHLTRKIRATSFYLLCVLPCGKGDDCSKSCCRIVRNFTANRQNLNGFGANLIKSILAFNCDLKASTQGSCASCRIKVNGSGKTHLDSIKKSLLQDLKNCWKTMWVNNFILVHISRQIDQDGISEILDVWRNLVDVRNSDMTFAQSREFTIATKCLVEYIGDDIELLLKRKILNVLNEVLCYGSTLAIQSDIPFEASEIAQKILRSVKQDNFFDGFRVPKSCPGIGGSCASGNDDELLPSLQVIQSVVLLHLKSVAIVIKESQAISSSSEDGGSDCSLSSRGSSSLAEEEREINLIASNVLQILNNIHKWVNGLTGRVCNITDTIVGLFQEQDDLLIESLLCLLDISINSNNHHQYFQQYQIHSESSTVASHVNATSSLTDMLDPLEGFELLLRNISGDHSVLLDFLLSNETCFLLYFLRLLKVINKKHLTGPRLGDQLSETLNRLKTSIGKLTNKSLFPYDINPVLRLLNKICA